MREVKVSFTFLPSDGHPGGHTHDVVLSGAPLAELEFLMRKGRHMSLAGEPVGIWVDGDTGPEVQVHPLGVRGEQHNRLVVVLACHHMPYVSEPLTSSYRRMVLAHE